MRLFIRSILYFFILLVISSYPVSYYISNHFSTYNKQNWILKKSGISFDYAVLGSSRVYNMIDIKSLDKAYEKKGINLGTSGSCYAENYLLLSEFISKNKISKLILNTDEFCFSAANTYSHPFHEYEFLNLFQKYDFVYYDYIPTWKYYLWKVVPLAKYCEYNKQFTIKKTSSVPLDKTMGSELKDEDNGENSLEFKKRQNEIKKIDEKYFLKIIELCSKNKIELILITTPIYTATKGDINDNFFKYIKSVSDREGIPYINYESLIDCGNVKYFNNNTHTNSIGSIEYSTNLGKRLKEDKN